MITSIDQFRIFENQNQKFYIYVGHGSGEGVVEFWPGHEFWNHDANKSCPMSFDILNPLHKYSMGKDRFPMTMNIEQIRDVLSRDFQYCEVITADEIPKYCKRYEPQPKEINWVNIRACYPAIKQFIKLDERDWRTFVKDFEQQIIQKRIQNVDMKVLCETFFYSLQTFKMFYYRDLCEVIDNQFKP